MKKNNQQTVNKDSDKQPEKLTEKDLRDLMGTNRQILKRGKGGAFR